MSHRRRIYVASSWRNAEYPAVVAALRGIGHDVYDFRNPAPGDNGFSWSEIDPEWQDWTPEAFVPLLVNHPTARRGFSFDKAALDWCDTCVLVAPCGYSAHLEAGYAAGQGKRVIVLLGADRFKPELMYLLCHGLVTNICDLVWAVAQPDRRYDVMDATWGDDAERSLRPPVA